jgi:hypothetical protein
MTAPVLFDGRVQVSVSPGARATRHAVLYVGVSTAHHSRARREPLQRLRGGCQTASQDNTGFTLPT